MPRDVQLRPIRVQLFSPGNVQLLWLDLTDMLDCAGAIGVSGRLVIVDKEGNFQAEVGIQTFDNDIEVGNTPVAPSVGTGLGMKNTQGKNFFTFDPTNASNGNIAGKFRFRVGVLYNSSAAGASRGEVLMDITIRYA